MTKRIDALFRRVLATTLAACGESTHTATDATTLPDSPVADAGVDVDPQCAPIAIDAAPYTDAPACEAMLVMPCGVPGDASYGCLMSINYCYEVCPNSDNVFRCRFGPGMCDEAGAPDANMVECIYCPGEPGRRPTGMRDVKAARGFPGRLARDAMFEEASVTAFRQLRERLLAFRAPRSLVRAASRAEQDERRHARIMHRLAVSAGARRQRAFCGPRSPLSLEAFLTENAVEGCVNETYAALVARWEARNATHGPLRRAMRTIAPDELRHAALAWSIHVWGMRSLDASARARVRQARSQALERLRGNLAQTFRSLAVFAE